MYQNKITVNQGFLLKNSGISCLALTDTLALLIPIKAGFLLRGQVSGLDIQVEQSENNNPVHKKSVAGWDSTSHIQFPPLTDTNLWLSG